MNRRYFIQGLVAAAAVPTLGRVYSFPTNIVLANSLPDSPPDYQWYCYHDWAVGGTLVYRYLENQAGKWVRRPDMDFTFYGVPTFEGRIAAGEHASKVAWTGKVKLPFYPEVPDEPVLLE